MNPNLNQLHPYPFQRLKQLFAGADPRADLAPISLSIGEPRHPTPPFIGEALIAHLHGLSNYPLTKGSTELREAIAGWLQRRFQLGEGGIDADTQVLPVNGTREALFAFAQAVIDSRPSSGGPPAVLMPNPFYQIYEGAALLAGAEPVYMNTLEENGFMPDLDAVPESTWQRCQLLYLCSPGNPAGAVATQADLQQLLALADRHDFIIAADECYAEIYPHEDQPPMGLLQACKRLGRDNYHRCVVFHSLSKRSNAPGLRSGFVAGDADILAKFLLYRTYHGCAMSAYAQAASVAAWSDEQHVRHNRELYRQKFAAVRAILKDTLDPPAPQGGFYLWPRLPGDDQQFARQLYQQQHVTVLPGSLLSRDADGCNPGSGRIRMALVAEPDDCVMAAERIAALVQSL